MNDDENEDVQEIPTSSFDDGVSDSVFEIANLLDQKNNLQESEYT